MTTIKGWEASHRYTQIAVRTLRELHRDGALHGAKNQRGVWEFSSDDLDRIVAANGKAATSMPVAPFSLLPTTASACSPPGALAWAERAADAARDATEGGDEDEQPEVEEGDDAVESDGLRSPSHWSTSSALSTSPTAATDTLAPIGVDPTTRRIIFATVPAAASHIAVQATLTSANRQVEAANAAVTSWRALWRATKVRAIADAIAAEAVMAGAVPAAVQAAWSAAGSAADQLTDEQLVDDGYALGVGRAAGTAASQRVMSVIAWHAAQSGAFGDGYDNDIERARERRRWRPRPRPRW